MAGSAHCFLCALCHKGTSFICTGYAIFQWLNESDRSVVGTSHVRCHMVRFTFIDHYYHIFRGFRSVSWIRLFGGFFCFEEALVLLSGHATVGCSGALWLRRRPLFVLHFVNSHNTAGSFCGSRRVSISYKRCEYSISLFRLTSLRI